MFKSYLAQSFIFSTSQNSDSVNLWGNYSYMKDITLVLILEKYSIKCGMGIYMLLVIKKYGSIKKHFIPRLDGHKSIDMYPGKVIYDSTMQEEIIADIFNFLEYLSENFYSFYNKAEEMNKQSVNNLVGYYNRAFGSAIRILVNQIKLF